MVSAILALLMFHSLAGGVVGFLSSGKGIATLCVRRAQDTGCRDLVTQINVGEPLVYSRLQSWRTFQKKWPQWLGMSGCIFLKQQHLLLGPVGNPEP